MKKRLPLGLGDVTPNNYPSYRVRLSELTDSAPTSSSSWRGCAAAIERSLTVGLLGRGGFWKMPESKRAGLLSYREYERNRVGCVALGVLNGSS